MPPPETNPPRPRTLLLLLLLLLPLSLPLLSTPHTPPPPPTHTTRHLLAHAPPRPHPCPHIVLITAARHGSTWLIDSAENCTSSAATYGTLNRYAELWNPSQPGPLRDLHPSAAAAYARANHSVKIFPAALDRDLALFLRHVRLHATPVFVLKRGLGHAYDSLALAKTTREWNARVVRADETRETGEREHGWRRYLGRMEDYFETVEGVLKEVGIVWDELFYEQIVKREIIVGERNGCYIRNCNFRW